MTWLLEHPRKTALGIVLALALVSALVGAGGALTGTRAAGASSESEVLATKQLRHARSDLAREHAARVRSETSLREVVGRARRWKARARRAEARMDAAKARARKRHRNGGSG